MSPHPSRTCGKQTAMPLLFLVPAPKLSTPITRTDRASEHGQQQPMSLSVTLVLSHNKPHG